MLSSHRKEESWTRPPTGGLRYHARNLNDLADFLSTREEGISRSPWRRSSVADGGGVHPWPLGVPFALPQFNGYAPQNAHQVPGRRRTARAGAPMRWLFSTRDLTEVEGPYLEDVKVQPKYRMLPRLFLDLVRDGKLPPYDPREYDHIPSCIWTTMMVVRGFQPECGHVEKGEVRRGRSFFLDRFFKRNYHSMSSSRRATGPSYGTPPSSALAFALWTS